MVYASASEYCCIMSTACLSSECSHGRCLQVSAAERKLHHHHGPHCSATSNSQTNDGNTNQPCELPPSSPRSLSPAQSHSDNASTSTASSAAHEVSPLDEAYLHGRQDEVHGRIRGSPISSMQRLWEGALPGSTSSSDDDTWTHDQQRQASSQASDNTMSDRQRGAGQQRHAVGQRFRTLLRRLFE